MRRLRRRMRKGARGEAFQLPQPPSARRDLETRWATIDLSRYPAHTQPPADLPSPSLSRLSYVARERFARDDEIQAPKSQKWGANLREGNRFRWKKRANSARRILAKKLLVLYYDSQLYQKESQPGFFLVAPSSRLLVFVHSRYSRRDTGCWSDDDAPRESP